MASVRSSEWIAILISLDTDVPEFIDQFEYIVFSNPNWDWRTFNLAGTGGIDAQPTSARCRRDELKKRPSLSTARSAGMTRSR
jgi:hypothetical protein